MTGTLVVALYGALLSTLGLLRDVRSRRRRGAVAAGYTFEVLSPENIRHVLRASFRNVGREPIFLESAFVSVERTASLYGHDPQGSLPCEIRPGQSVNITFDAGHVWDTASSKANPIIQVVFYDQVGVRYTSEWLDVHTFDKAQRVLEHIPVTNGAKRANMIDRLLLRGPTRGVA
jgi:hypothetical protein